jgi:hypothetical protein
VPEGLPLHVCEPDATWLGDADELRVAAKLGDVDILPVMVCDAVASCDGVAVSVGVCVDELDRTCESDIDADGVCAADVVPLWEGESVPCCVAVRLSLPVGDPVVSWLGVRDAEGDPVAVPVLTIVAVEDPVVLDVPDILCVEACEDVTS